MVTSSGGQLEQRVRQIEGVVACSVSGDAVSVLVEPTADMAAVERAVAALVLASGRASAVTVLGGAAGTATAASAPAASAVAGQAARRFVPVLVAGAGALVVTLAGAVGILQSDETARSAPSPAREAQRDVTTTTVPRRTTTTVARVDGAVPPAPASPVVAPPPLPPAPPPDAVATRPATSDSEPLADDAYVGRRPPSLSARDSGR